MKGQVGPGVGNRRARLYNATVNSFYSEGWFRSLFGLFVAFMFWYVFNSYFLGFLALAFLFYIPVDPQNPPRGVTNPNFWLFGIMMVVLYMWAFGIIGTGLELEIGGAWYNPLTWNTSAIIFATIWLISLVSGVFGDLHSRQSVGVIMIFVSFVLFASGVGGQDVGAAMFGQWWPTVHNMGSQILSPIGEAFGSLSQTLGQGWMLLTNPVGYATQLMNGTYAQNPVGETGSYGVDITDFTITNIFPEQPFVVTAILGNKGAFKAENVKMSLQVLGGDKFATGGTSRTRSLQWTYNPYDVYGRKTTLIDIEKLGFNGGMACNYLSEDGKECFQCYGVDLSTTGSCSGEDLDRLMLWQAAFQSSGITCNTIVGSSLRKRFIPIMAAVTYGYKSESRVEVEFISKAEWERLAQAGQLDSRFRFIESQYSSAPVKFPIGTAGLKNPIMENQQFHISMMIDSAFESGGQIDKLESVELRYPDEWKLRSARCPNAVSIDEKNGIVVWKPNAGGGQTFYCYFESLNKNPNAMGGAPSKTYVVTANASYTFSRWKYKDTQIQFGGFCCPDTTGCTENCESEDCLDGQYCVNNACVYMQGWDGGGGAQTKPGDADFCQKKIAGELKAMGYDESKCRIGMGGCQSGECGGNMPDCNEDGKIDTLSCVQVAGVPGRMCCSLSEFNQGQCKALYDKFIELGRPLSEGPGSEVDGICYDNALR